VVVMIDDIEQTANDKYIANQLASWDRLLLIVSVPHAAALSAFFGRYNFNVDGQYKNTEFLSILIFVSLLPIVTIWLYFAQDLLRNTFLRNGDGSKSFANRNSLIFIAIIFVPLMLAIFADQFSLYVDRQSLFLVSMVLLSWGACLLLISSFIYINIRKALGFS
jgi:hypothetical protein